MESFSLQSVLEWVAQHGAVANIIVFFIAFSESLAFIGLIMPGVVLMFGIGALIATGTIPLWSTMAWAAAGAVAGDTTSYWLGRYYKMRLRTLWPFRRYPKLMNRGVDFFHRHGGKSVVLGRFIGPLRPIIPAVAGMLEMSPPRFVMIDTLSGIAWAPLYLLPGMAFGTSLALASEVAGRLAVFLVVTLTLLWFMGWLLWRTWTLLAPRTNIMIYRALQWTHTHPVLGRLPAAVVDPGHPETRGLTLLALLLLVSSIVITWLIPALTGSALLENLDELVFHSLQTLRTPWVDRLMILMTGMGGTFVLSIIVILVSAWLAWQRHWQALGHWLAAVGFTFAMTHILKRAIQVARPITVEGAGETFSFPSGHASLSTAVYGFLAIMLVRELPNRLHAATYIVTGLLVTVIGFTRLYLGVHWLSDVLGGLCLGLAWIAILGIAYRRHAAAPIPHRRFGLLVVLVLVFASVANVVFQFPANLNAYVPHHPETRIAARSWWQHGWENLAAYRNDLWANHNQPINIQWVGALEEIRRSLLAQGWNEPPNGIENLMHWFRPDANLNTIPVLPQVHDGRQEALRLTHEALFPGHLLVIRLWPTDIHLTSGNQEVPLWIGNITYLRLTRTLGLSLLRTDNTCSASLVSLTKALCREGWDIRYTQRVTTPAIERDARVALIR